MECPTYIYKSIIYKIRKYMAVHAPLQSLRERLSIYTKYL